MRRFLLVLLAVLGAAPTQASGRGADGRFDSRSSSHFALLQDVDIDQSGGFYGSRRFEQGVLRVLEQAYQQLGERLGLRPARRIRVVIYDPQIFDAEFGHFFRFSAAGFYAGVIRIRGATRVDDGLVRVLHHELVHAAVDMAAPSLVLPAWLNEGLAEWFEARAFGQRDLAPWQAAAMSGAGRRGRLFSLAELSSPSLSHLQQDAAALAYLESYAFVTYLARTHGESSLGELLATLFRSRDLDRALRRTYRADLARLEQRFAEQWR